jgi:ABC-2 type transport system ATP-binding protein
MIRVENLRLSFKDSEILRGVNLRLRPGDIYGLLGPNGAGKSTTVFALLGLQARSGGLIEVLGSDPQDRALDIRRLIGVMPERASFYDWMTAFQYLRCYARLYRREPGDQELGELLDRLGLGEAGNRPVGSYSRGMKQRLAMARALTPQPRLLILDEPTNGLDPKGRREIHDLLLDFTAGGETGVLLCTHLLDDVERLCNRIGIVDQGRTRIEGSPSQLLAGNNNWRRYKLRLEDALEDSTLPEGVSLSIPSNGWLRIQLPVGYPGGPAALWEQLWQRGWRILEIRSETSSLEEIYLSLTSEARSSAKEKSQ